MATFRVGMRSNVEDRPFIILHDVKQFHLWYLEQFDLSMFAEPEIEAFLDEAQPEGYPCIPFYGEHDSSFPSHFICVQHIEFWMKNIRNGRAYSELC